VTSYPFASSQRSIGYSSLNRKQMAPMDAGRERVSNGDCTSPCTRDRSGSCWLQRPNRRATAAGSLGSQDQSTRCRRATPYPRSERECRPRGFQLVPTPSGGLNNGDPGADYTASGPATHSLMSYKHKSGAIVFGAGTTRWSWGLDATHDAGDIPSGDPAPTIDLNIQQATVNLLADMGVQPQTLAGNLVPSSPSTDTVPPVTSITSPAANASLTQNTAVQITGTAVDAAGQVCGVEVSVDGGTTWRPAQPTGGTQGFSTWAFTWTPTTTGSATIMARGVDDSLNQESPVSTSETVVAGGAAPSLWPNNPTPSNVTVNDPNAVELGVKVQSSQAGGILGIRFYKGPQNTGTHVGSLWDSGGNLLGHVTFSGETASGWQQMNFATPINISANTTYIASYHTNAALRGAEID
jgi:uncharacterized protein DUF4082/Big-like domain-containing protein